MSTRTGDLTVIQVIYGDRLTRKSVVFHGFADSGETDADQPMDYAFWIAHNDDATILVDTGYDIAGHDWLGEISRTPPPEGLSLLGIDPAAVTMVIATHFHYDHIGYVHLFPNATVVAAQTEFDHWTDKYEENGLVGEFVAVDDLRAILLARDEGRLRLVSSATEVHPGVTVHPVGGHCPGQLVVEVASASGPLILASDAIHLAEQLEKGWAFFAHTDLDEMMRALAFVRERAAAIGARVIPGHDPRTAREHPPVDGPAATFANVLG